MKTTMNIAHRRLFTQYIAAQKLEKPADIVRWMGAIQAQDFPGAKWAVGQRLLNATDGTVEQAFARGEILRTHVMRPTWHFVAPEDIRWLLKLTGPRVNSTSTYYCRILGLDDALFRKSNDAIRIALEGGKQLTRPELMSALQRVGINTEGTQRGSILMMRAEQDGIVCSGAKKGKQFTYALLDEVVPPTKPLEYHEALGELTLRYFTGHGPATERDFAWWSGLTLGDVRAGIEIVRSALMQEEIEGTTYWSEVSAPDMTERRQEAYLLPNLDEYTVGYADRSAIAGLVTEDDLDSRGTAVLNNAIVIDGQVVGNWKRTLKKDGVLLETKLFAMYTGNAGEALSVAAERYARFLDLRVTLVA